MQMDSNKEELYLKTLINHQVLATILHDCVEEFRNTPIERIARDSFGHKPVILPVDACKNHPQKPLNPQGDVFINQGTFDVALNKMEGLPDGSQSPFDPTQALFFKASEPQSGQKIGIAIGLVFKNGTTIRKEDQRFFAHMTLKMEKRFSQIIDGSIDRFYSILMITQLSAQSEKLCRIIQLTFVNGDVERPETWQLINLLRCVLSDLSKRNEKEWEHIRMLQLLWDDKMALEQKLVDLQRGFKIQVDLELAKNLKQIESDPTLCQIQVVSE